MAHGEPRRADDLAAIDSGFAQNLTGYYNGDWDYSGGKPDADDYFMVDRAFAGQGAPMSGASAPVEAAAASAPLAETITAPASTKKVRASTFSRGPAVKAKRRAVPPLQESENSAHKSKKRLRNPFDL